MEISGNEVRKMTSEPGSPLFDPDRAVVPEAIERIERLEKEISARAEEIEGLRTQVYERETSIQTHLMHIASCVEALKPLRAVTDRADNPSMTTPVQQEQGRSY